MRQSNNSLWLTVNSALFLTNSWGSILTWSVIDWRSLRSSPPTSPHSLSSHLTPPCHHHKVWMYIPGWPWTHRSWLLRLQTCSSTPGLILSLILYPRSLGRKAVKKVPSHRPEIRFRAYARLWLVILNYSFMRPYPILIYRHLTFHFEIMNFNVFYIQNIGLKMSVV